MPTTTQASQQVYVGFTVQAAEKPTPAAKEELERSTAAALELDDSDATIAYFDVVVEKHWYPNSTSTTASTTTTNPVRRCLLYTSPSPRDRG